MRWVAGILICTLAGIFLIDSSESVSGLAEKKSYPPCLPKVQLSKKQLTLNSQELRREIVRRLERGEELLKKTSDPDYLWEALIAAEEASAFLDRECEGRERLKVRQINLSQRLVSDQHREIKSLMLEIARQKHLKNSSQKKYFLRRLLRFVPLRSHSLHQDLRWELRDW